MDHIHDGKGRFICVMPRSRLEDGEFREWIQTHAPEWTLVWDRPNRRRRRGPRDRWWVFRYPLPSREGWPVVWVHSSLLALRQEQTRRENLTRAVQELEDLNVRLAGPRPRHRLRREVEQRVGEILDSCRARRYLKVVPTQAQQHRFRQAKPGRPGPNTQYVRRTRRFWRLAWELDQAAVDYDGKSDGMYPLLTNDRALADAEVLEAHKRQPTIEKRFQQTKTVMEIAPVLLKNEGRVEALFFLYFVALLLQALIERQIRLGMKTADIQELPLYPEERTTKRPTTDQILRLFSHAQRHVLRYRDVEVKTFEPELTPLQRQVLQLLGLPADVYEPRG